MVGVVQINLHHSKAASAALVLRLAEREEDIALIQEPWVVKDRVCGLNSKDYKLLYVMDKGKPRSCILLKKHINVYSLIQFSDADNVVISVESCGRTIWFASAYMAHDAVQQPPSLLIRGAVEEASRQGIPFILGADANAHHHAWGSSDTNERGEYVFEFIMRNNLHISNIGDTPTFISTTRREVLDITCVNERGAQILKDWRVSKDNSFSDHRYLIYSISLPTRQCKPVVNRRRTNWGMFETTLANNLFGVTSQIDSELQLDSTVDELTSAFQNAAKAACPPRTRRGKPKPTWWSIDIANLRRECRTKYNEARRTNSWERYRECQRRFKYAIRAAKTASWRNFCQNIESVSETSRLRKVVSMSPSNPSYLMKEDGNWTTNSEETLELLMQTHFPGCLGNEDSRTHPIVHNGNPPIDFITEDNIKYAIGSFRPYKSPGPDGIIPADLQHTIDIIGPRLKSIFEASIRLKHIPKKWTEVKVVFIPKGGKTTHTKPKDYRPISLSSFLLKSLERLLDIHIKGTISNKISPSQHAYSKGKSVETALHSLVDTIEKSLHYKEYTLAAFLDIEGAFNNIYPEAITRSLTEMGVNSGLVSFIERMLIGRTISAHLGESSVKKFPVRGTPQGGVISPLLWNLTVNNLLQELENMGGKIISYADDIVIAISGKHLPTLCDLQQRSLNRLSLWCESRGLKVNPEKTDIILFSRRHKIPALKQITLGGKPIRVTERAKYLGLVLDRKLNWGLTVADRVRKATTALYSCGRLIGKKWGLKPRMIHWLYTAVVRPILYYGIIVWWHVLEKGVNIKRVDKVQRLASVLITGAMSTTPSKALYATLNLLPVDLQAKYMARCAAIRLNTLSKWSNTSYGHGKILADISGLPGLVDYALPPTLAITTFRTLLPSRGEWKRDDVRQGESIHVYTDGSKLEGRVGGGVYSEHLGISHSFRLPDYCSVFQAELMAIIKAVTLVKCDTISGNDIYIFTDSQAAIKSLTKQWNTSKVAMKCRTSLNEMAESFHLKVTWVPGHCDIEGNCKADELARLGTKLTNEYTDNDIGIPLQTCKLLIFEEVVRAANERWHNETTCRIARQLWPNLNAKRTESLLSQGKNSLSTLISVLTGHCLIGRHAQRMGVQTHDFCRSCLDEEEEETILHLLCHCPALSRRRFTILGRQFFNELEDLSTVEIRDLLKFLKSSHWF